MRKVIRYALILFVLQSCIPLRVAPTIEDYKVTRGKRFKRSLSKREMFIFQDPKLAGQFYDYVNIKYHLNHENVYDDVPFLINGEQYFFSFYEVQIPDKTLNLAPLLLHLAVNAALGNEDPLEHYDADGDINKRENWYIAIEVYSDLEKDCLADAALSREAVLKYLRVLKKEYLTTYNYHETVFKN